MGGRPLVPDHQLLVVSHGSEEGLVEEVPSNVLNHGGVTRENGFGVDYFVFGGGVDVPQADGVVIAVADRVWPPTQFSYICFLPAEG